MGRKKLGTEYKRSSDYRYDYPENREVAKSLTIDDKYLIAEKTKYTYRYVRDWCSGRRRNAVIEMWANRIREINKSKQQLLK